VAGEGGGRRGAVAKLRRAIVHAGGRKIEGKRAGKDPQPKVELQQQQRSGEAAAAGLMASWARGGVLKGSRGPWRTGPVLRAAGEGQDAAVSDASLSRTRAGCRG
jgi:hypothetical protein